MRIYSRGFTLIELLVVISIIGMLSSIVLASLSSAREKAVRAAAITFATGAYRALGADPIMILDFDNNILNYLGERLKTLPSNGANPQFQGFSLSQSSETPMEKGSSGNFQGNGALVVELDPPVSLSQFSVAMWLKPSLCNGCIVFNAVDSGGDRQMNLQIEGPPANKTTIGHSPLWAPFSDISIPFNKWTHIAYSYNNQIYTLYINGKVMGTKNVTTAPGNISKVIIGNLSNGSSYQYNGQIDDFSIFKESFTASQIERIYAQGLQSHKIALIK